MWDIQSAIAAIDKRCLHDSRDSETDSPIFIISAGWRSGSTLLQRLVMSSNEVLVWGEPFGACGLIQRLSDSLVGVSEELAPDHYFIDAWPRGTLLHEEFVANLYPNVHSLREAHREFFRRLYATPARDAGFARWGIKEVRLRAEHAYYLRWLFPAARVVFLFRNPFLSYRSYRRFNNWHYSSPDDRVTTPARFGEIWAEGVQGYLEHSSALGARTVKYEDLCSRASVIDELSAYLGVHLRSEVLGNWVYGPSRRSPADELPEVPQPELEALSEAVAPVARQVGYRCM